MRQWMKNAILGGGFLFLASGAFAQYGPYSDRPYRDDPYYRNDPYNRNDPYYRNNPYGNSGQYGYGRNGGDVINRTLSDLDSLRSYNYVDGHERKHFDQARSNLMRFQQNWMNGRFDRDRLDGACGNLQHLVNAAQVAPRDRERLARDLYALRELRSSGGGYDYRRRY